MIESIHQKIIAPKIAALLQLPKIVKEWCIKRLLKKSFSEAESVGIHEENEMAKKELHKREAKLHRKEESLHRTADKAVKKDLKVHKQIEKLHKKEDKKDPKPKNKVEKVMHEYKEGKLHSGSKKGPEVSSRKQAVAIALSEARKAGEKVKPKKKKK